MNESTRLRYRELTPDDLADLHRLWSDRAVTAFVNVYSGSISHSQLSLEHLLEDQKEGALRMRYVLAAVRKDTGAFVGTCQLRVVNREHKCAMLGYTIRQEEWRKGYGTEVARALLTFGFKELGFHRMEAVARPENKHSWHILERVGMHREGTLRGHRYFHDRWWNSHIYALLEGEYRDR